MNIVGSIQIYKDNQIISKGKNLITNIGKSIFLDWFCHNNYGNYDKTVYTGGSLSTQRFLSPNQFLIKDINSINSNGYYDFYSGIYGSTINGNYVLYCQINRQISLSGLYLNLKGAMKYIKIYTSEFNITQSNLNQKWKLKKITLPNFMIDNMVSDSKTIRFDNIDSADGYIKNVKSIKIQFSYKGDGNLTIKGLGLLEKQPYPNVPCAIGLGNGDVMVNNEDTKLTNQLCRVFVNRQYCNVWYNYNTEKPYQVDLNKLFSQQDGSQINKIDIVYVSRLNYSQFNGVEFKQIGLFYPSEQVSYRGGVKTCDKLFSHGLFQEPWIKTNNQIIDIKYTISLGV